MQDRFCIEHPKEVTFQRSYKEAASQHFGLPSWRCVNISCNSWMTIYHYWQSDIEWVDPEARDEYRLKYKAQIEIGLEMINLIKAVVLPRQCPRDCFDRMCPHSILFLPNRGISDASTSET